MKLFILFFTLLCVIPSTHAQEQPMVSFPLAEYEMMKQREDSINRESHTQADSIQNLHIILSKRDEDIKTLKDQLILLEERCQLLLRKETQQRDSIHILRERIEGLESDAKSLDRVRVRYANGRLALPYDKDKIRDAIELYDGIADTNIKSANKEVVYWLNAYQENLQNLLTVFQSLQEDKRRTDKFDFEAWVAYAKRENNNSAYSRASKGSDFSIRYLNDIIKLANKRLDNAGKTPSIDFSDLIDRLNL